MATKATLEAIITIATFAGTNAPAVIARLRPLFKEGQEAELQAELDGSDAGADTADAKAEQALRG